MKPIEIPSLEDDRIYVPFTMPVKGRKPIEFKLPRLDFTPTEDAKLVVWLLSELDYDPDKVAELVEPDSPNAVEKAGILLMLKPHVTDQQFKILQTCVVGQLKFINDRWQEQSRVTLGEYWASAGSSTSTQRPSKRSSSTKDGTSGTSDDDSDGQSSEAS